jgi:hypothetical protein
MSKSLRLTEELGSHAEGEVQEANENKNDKNVNVRHRPENQSRFTWAC